MPPSRTVINSERVFNNLEQAAQLSAILLPHEYFSQHLADYCNEISMAHQIHSISAPIVLLHIAATTSQQSLVSSSSESTPLSLYSLVFARPAFGKSKILRIVTKCLDIICNYMPNNFESSSTLNEEIHSKPYYHDATTAGMIAAANSTKLFVINEADIVLNQISAFPQSSYSNKQVARSHTDARHLLLKLYDNDLHVKQYKKSSTATSMSNHTILGASNGLIIEQQLEYKQNTGHVDTLFERFLLWPLDPAPIMLKSNIYIINKKYPTLYHFSIILALLSNCHLTFTSDAQEKIINFGNELKNTAYLERNDRSLSAKIGYMHQNTLRVVGIIQILECAFILAQEYLITHGEFPDITNEFIVEMQAILVQLYPLPCDDNIRRIVIDIEVVCRGINVMQSLLEQYKLLMFLPSEISTFRASTINLPMTSTQIVQAQDMSFTKKIDQIHIRQILLFESVIFSPKTIISKISSIRHNCKNLHANLQKLSTIGLLIFFDNGTIAKTKKAHIYVKRFPDPNHIIDQQNHEALLAQFNDHFLTTETFRSSTTKAYVLTKSPLRTEVIKVLQSSAYSTFNFDLSNITEKNQIIHNTNNDDHDLVLDESTTSSNEPNPVVMNDTNLNQTQSQNIFSSSSPTTSNSMINVSSSVQNSTQNSFLDIESPGAVLAFLQQIDRENTHTNQGSVMNVHNVSLLPTSSAQNISTCSYETSTSSIICSSNQSHETKKRKQELNKKMVTKRMNTHASHDELDVDTQQQTINEHKNNTSNEQQIITDPQYIEDNQQHTTNNSNDNISTDNEDESLDVQIQNNANGKKRKQKKPKKITKSKKKSSSKSSKSY